MPELKTVAPATQTTLVCRLRHRQLRRGGRPTSGEVELENASRGVIEIENDMHPLQYLNIVVADAGGAVVSEGHHGDCFSPRGSVATLRLAPGEKYTHNVPLLGTLPREKWLPGAYTVRAVYEYRGLRAVSEPLQVELTAQDADGGI